MKNDLSSVTNSHAPSFDPATIRYEQLQPGTPGFSEFTFPKYHDLLSFVPPPAPIAIAAWDGDQPVGLLLARQTLDKSFAVLFSIMVKAPYRQHGIGTSLLRQLDQILIDQGISCLRCNYLTTLPCAASLENLLAREGWSDPKPNMLILRCTLESVRGAPWLEIDRVQGFEIVPWVSLGKEVREEIRQSDEAEHWIAPDLNPFDYEFRCNQATSTALLQNGKVRGWIITHQLDNVLRFTCSFVHPKLQRLGRLLLLVRESVHRAADSGFCEAMWTIPFSHASMAKFAQKWMQPYAVAFGESRDREKNFN